MEKLGEKDEKSGMLNTVNAAFHGINPRNPALLSPTVLAYIGDTVFDLFVRTYYLEATDQTAHGLHVSCASKVCAKAQAEAFFKVEPHLNEQELAVYKRGRNAHLGAVPKNAKITDYRTATGLEALLGYLYLSNQEERLAKIVRMALFAPETNESER
ncbi:MAG TPA: ribonuclease III domain-containing protein [Clostridia bacterium]|nr:ribonuclease III domain-containing protein [Clostridia bacterium]